MTNKNKLLGISLATLALIGTAAAVSVERSGLSMRADDTAYTLNVSQVSASELASGAFTRTTAAGNAVDFNINGCSSTDGAALFQFDGYESYVEIASTSKISGITKIEVTASVGLESGYRLYYSNTYGDKTTFINHNVGRWGTQETQKKTSFTLPTASNYFRIKHNGWTRSGYGDIKKIQIYELKVYYTCETASQKDREEVLSGDMLYGMTQADTSWTYQYDNRSEYTSTGTGYSSKFSCDSTGAGWPSALLRLANSYNLYDYEALSVTAKFDVAHPWISLRFYDSKWAQLTDTCGIDFVGGQTKWVNGSISVSEIESKLKSGMTLSDIKFIRIGFNFDKYQGSNQAGYLDEMHLVEKCNANKNNENVWIDTGDSTCTANAYDYFYHTANSVSSRKFTFTDATLKSSQVFVSFGPQGTFGTNLAVMNAGTFEFDLKLSDEFLTSGHQYQHMFTLNIIDQSWAGHEPWLNLTNNGAWGFNPTMTDEQGFFHVSIDLASETKYAAITSGAIRLKFGFWGITEETKNSAAVWFDNINFTPAA